MRITLGGVTALSGGSLFLEPQHDFGNSRVGNGHGARTCYSRFKQHAWNFRLRPYLSDGPNVHPAWAPAYEAEAGPGWEQVSEDLQQVGRNNVQYCSGTSLWTRYLVRLVNRPSNWLTLDVWVWNKHTAPADGHVINGALVGTHTSPDNLPDAQSVVGGQKRRPTPGAARGAGVDKKKVI